MVRIWAITTWYCGCGWIGIIKFENIEKVIFFLNVFVLDIMKEVPISCSIKLMFIVPVPYKSCKYTLPFRSEKKRFFHCP
jgi:hypothetical protein